MLNGRAKAQKRGKSTVVKVGSEPGNEPRGRDYTTSGTSGANTREDQYVELAREATDRIFVVLAEFGNERHPDYPDQDTDPKTPGPARFDGPLHNEIREPDRAIDNSTIWQQDYSAGHFRQLYFGDAGESVRTFYEQRRPVATASRAPSPTG